MNTNLDINQHSMNNDRGKPEVSSKSSLKLDKDNDQQKTDDQIDSPSTAPLKTFKKSSSGKKSNIKYLILIFFILVLGTVGVLYITQQQQETPVPTVPESEPEAAIETWCTLTFSVPTPTATPTPTPEPTPVPLYPQCHTIIMLDQEGNTVNEDNLIINQAITLVCQGNVPTEPGAVEIKWMEFRDLKKEPCSPGEECDPIKAEQVWTSKNEDSLEINDNIVSGFTNYVPQFGTHALQCRICTNDLDQECDGEWDNVLNWPEIPEKSEPTPIPNVTRLPSRPPKDLTPVPELSVTLVPTTYEDPSLGGCKPSDCGDYRNIRCIGTERLVCKRNEDDVCAWQCEPSNIR